MHEESEAFEPSFLRWYIPDNEADKRLSFEVVLTRLRKMNDGLNKQEWVTLYQKISCLSQS